MGENGRKKEINGSSTKRIIKKLRLLTLITKTKKLVTGKNPMTIKNKTISIHN